MKKFALGLILLAFSIGCPLSAHSGSEFIEVYFTAPIAGLPWMDKPSVQANGVDTALIALIDSAQKTIDAAIYRLTHQPIITALQRTCARGVSVRIVTDQSSVEEFSSEYNQLQSLPCVTLKTDASADARERFDHTMHHKFAIIDSSIIWTGSLNWADRELFFDANNALVIRDERIAQLFTTEFNEMFLKGRFGQQKYDGKVFTQLRTYSVGSATVGVHFTPSGAPQKIVRDAIRNAKNLFRSRCFTSPMIF